MERLIVEIWQSYVSGPSRHRQPIKFQNLKIQDGGGRHLEKSKNPNIFGTY